MMTTTDSCERKCSSCKWYLSIPDPIDVHDLNYNITQVYCLLNGEQLARKCSLREAENLTVSDNKCPLTKGQKQ